MEKLLAEYKSLRTRTISEFDEFDIVAVEARNAILAGLDASIATIKEYIGGDGEFNHAG